MPALSTTAIATGQPFFFASASAAATALRACSSVTFGPYCGTWANAIVDASSNEAPATARRQRTIMVSPWAVVVAGLEAGGPSLLPGGNARFGTPRTQTPRLLERLGVWLEGPWL